MTEKPKYAVIDVSKDDYKTFGYNFAKAFEDQLKNMFEPAIRNAVNNLVWNLTDKTSENRYPEKFCDILNTAFVKAVTDEDYIMHEPEIESLRTNYDLRYKEISDIKSQARH